jgi:hypothetical protein
MSEFVRTKDERPVGVPAALAWGIGDTYLKVSSSRCFFEALAVRLRSQAAERRTGVRS